ncbi:hypothetical protein GJAV_G00212920 [Gymnothorax javanicus]|nr:hypothetical protein GJAV_G00212920 [Gymnothorax javanicus]
MGVADWCEAPIRYLFIPKPDGKGSRFLSHHALHVCAVYSVEVVDRVVHWCGAFSFIYGETSITERPMSPCLHVKPLAILTV